MATESWNDFKCDGAPKRAWLLESKDLGDDGRPRYIGRGVADKDGLVIVKDPHFASPQKTRAEARKTIQLFNLGNRWRPVEHIIHANGATRMTLLRRIVEWLDRVIDRKRK